MAGQRNFSRKRKSHTELYKAITMPHTVIQKDTFKILNHVLSSISQQYKIDLKIKIS